MTTILITHPETGHIVEVDHTTLDVHAAAGWVPCDADGTPVENWEPPMSIEERGALERQLTALGNANDAELAYLEALAAEDPDAVAALEEVTEPDQPTAKPARKTKATEAPDTTSQED